MNANKLIKMCFRLKWFQITVVLALYFLAGLDASKSTMKSRNSLSDWLLADDNSPDKFLRAERNVAQDLEFFNESSRTIKGRNTGERSRSNNGSKKQNNGLAKSGNSAKENPHHHQRRGGGGGGGGGGSRGGGRGQRQRMNKNALRLLSGVSDNMDGGGAFPPLFNIAPRAIITVNATCGQHGREEYCKMLDAHPKNAWSTQCGICDGHSLDFDKRHPIESVLDSGNTWWQSPTLQNGHNQEYVTITFDLKQTFQVFFIMIKAAISPRPASWILEKSLDNITFEPWQYFGISDVDCRGRYNLPGQTGKHIFQNDDEVICTTQFSKAVPLENGEIHVSLVKNRPGALSQSQQLMSFITARFVRIRLQGMHSTANADNSIGWLLDAQAMEKRSFYSIKLIRISGRLACSGHATDIIEVGDDERDTILRCDCLHNTCGSDCSECCPLYNQVPYRRGTFKTENICEACQCYGHSKTCIYDVDVDKNGLSINKIGVITGGGVCLNCTGYTTGINCEKCLDGYFRPYDISLHMPCEKCECDLSRSTGFCDPDSGRCECREGFDGFNCDFCAPGYRGDSCTKCSCDSRGTMPGGECEEHCQCKLHVDGKDCSECVPGYFGLRASSPEGCVKCFCSGVGLSCTSYEVVTKVFESMEEWLITDIAKSTISYPEVDVETGNLVFNMYEMTDIEAIYWLAPKGYTGNKLLNYGSMVSFKISWSVVRGDTSGKPCSGPNLILIGKNGIKIAFADEIFDDVSSATIEVPLMEEGWYHVPSSVKDIATRHRRTEYHGDPVTRVQFMSVLTDIESVLVRGTFHTDQADCTLERAALYSGSVESTSTEMSLVEKCMCPPGYMGLSCETCSFGYIRVYENSSAHELVGKCLPCPCNGHAKQCNYETGECGECIHNTFGERCERCKMGYYGNAMLGSPDDCRPCACPLLSDGNNFSPSCQLKKFSLDAHHVDQIENESFAEYVCTQCPAGYHGDHCELCDDGYWGNPTIVGSKCLPCPCNGGPCDQDTGKCMTCLGNTEGWRCERCITGYWGDAFSGCDPCDCYKDGSESEFCDIETGQCVCKPNFAGLKCDECASGFTELDLDCVSCGCNENGSISSYCDQDNGQCVCKLGVQGLKCDECQDDYFGLTFDGCEGE